MATLEELAERRAAALLRLHMALPKERRRVIEILTDHMTATDIEKLAAAWEARRPV
jgi:hypothetical protein